jgi:hypothetical protein
MPRRRYCDDEKPDEEDFSNTEPDEEDFSNTRQEPEDVRAAPGIPTLYEIRRHIHEHAWNGDECLPSMTNEQVFAGQCEYASTAISEILTGTGKNGKPVDWNLRVRGWYTGDLGGIRSRYGCDGHVANGKHCHSWVEHGGKIIDATWWQFAGGEVRVYVFELGDPRFVRDESA